MEPPNGTKAARDGIPFPFSPGMEELFRMLEGSPWPGSALLRRALPLAGVEGLSAGSLGAVLSMRNAAECLINGFEEEHGERMGRVREGLMSDLEPGSAGESVKELLSAGPDDTPAAFMHRLLLASFIVCNPAMGPYRGMFVKGLFDEEVWFRAALEDARRHLGEPVELLMAPVDAHPHSLPDQLRQLFTDWSARLDPETLRKIGIGLDILREESRPRFGGPGPPRALDTGDRELYPEYEAFTEDRDWMEELVLIARPVRVWLWQLSKRYGYSIRRLDRIPDRELDILAQRGISGLWLIGLWERSPASMTIKRWSGNPEALASAYSIFGYEVAEELGGWDALEELRGRAAARGIRLGADMVPNHTGLDSRWVREHPEWFVQSPVCPFPGYTFSGENLSGEPSINIRLEDHYFDHSDAAVVFKWTRGTETRYIYHGNDGTSVPWNDTAQLNLLLPEVREALKGEILRIAGHFDLIRFDAAMTLTRKHFRRLWYPPPGSGGDVPGRAGSGVTEEEFDTHFPVEFWREVVDLVSEREPDTLLLAEAFWLMEGYFVRTLGMHRVYNSAFMNMLRLEKNGEYLTMLKDVLEFDPRILERFVNFMNNPDEESAAVQFGTGEKYTGVALMMATLPGLPMLGHGQIEGFRERYGMEYARPYLDEEVNRELVEVHERYIFPLLRARWLFSGVENFLLYELANENVFVYSNRRGKRAALVVYNNCNTPARVRVRDSVSTRELSSGRLVRRGLVDGLGLADVPQDACISVRDHVSTLVRVLSVEELSRNGLELETGPYQCMVIEGFEVLPQDEPWIDLYRISPGWVGSLEEEMADMRMKDVLDPLGRALNGERDELMRLAQACGRHIGVEPEEAGALIARLEVAEQLSQGVESGGAYLPLLRAWALLPRDTTGMRHAGVFGSLRFPGALARNLRENGMSADGAHERVEMTALHERIGALLETDPHLWLGALVDDPEGARLAGLNEHDGVRYLRKEGFEGVLEVAILLDSLDILSFGGAAGRDKMELLFGLSAEQKLLRDAARSAGWNVDEMLEMRFPKIGQAPACHTHE